MMSRQALQLVGGRKQGGDPVYEEVPVDQLGPGRYRLVASPGIVLGVASGDVIEIDPGREEGFRVVERGRNLCVHVYTQADPRSLTSEVEMIGGWNDGGVPGKLVILSVPVKAGFSRIEDILNRYVAENRGAEWYYGNVYDPRDGVTPLDWWK